MRIASRTASAKTAERAAKRLGSPKILERTRSGVKAAQVVGVISVPGATLEILPKIDGPDEGVRKALVHMLCVAWNLRVADGELARLGSQRSNLLELLVGLFANRSLEAVRRGLPRRYVGHEEDLKLMRGQLHVVRQITALTARPDVLACRFDELSEDTPLNRVLKAAVVRQPIRRSFCGHRLRPRALVNSMVWSDVTPCLRLASRRSTTRYLIRRLSRVIRKTPCEIKELIHSKSMYARSAATILSLGRLRRSDARRTAGRRHRRIPCHRSARARRAPRWIATGVCIYDLGCRVARTL